MVADIAEALDELSAERGCAPSSCARAQASRSGPPGMTSTNCRRGRRDPLGWHDPLKMLIRAIESHSAPVIALIEGGVFGGACEAAMACDIVVAAPNATFALTPAKLGVPYDVSGMLTFLNGASLRAIKEMAFTATADRRDASARHRIDQSYRRAATKSNRSPTPWPPISSKTRHCRSPS